MTPENREAIRKFLTDERAIIKNALLATTYSDDSIETKEIIIKLSIQKEFLDQLRLNLERY